MMIFKSILSPRITCISADQVAAFSGHSDRMLTKVYLIGGSIIDLGTSVINFAEVLKQQQQNPGKHVEALMDNQIRDSGLESPATPLSPS